MKKSRYQVKLAERLLIALIAVAGIVTGSFLDLKIAQSVYNPDSGFGAFFETFGESIAYARIPLGGVLLFKGFFDKKTAYKKAIAVLFLILSDLACIYFLADSFTYAHNDYGRRLNTVPSYIVATIITLAFSALFFFVILNENKSYLLQIGFIILVSRLAQFIVMKVLKNRAARPRYRYLVDSSLNTSGDTFRNWWQFDFHGFGSLADSFKSWPSGHTATAAQLLLLPLIYPVLKWKLPMGRTRLFFLSLIIVIRIAFSRRVYGAHFLSDVSFGLFVGAFMAYLTTFVSYRLIGKKKMQEKEN